MDVKEIKQSVDIITIVNRKVKLTPKGRLYVGLCPFHSEKTPSFSVSPKTQRFKCFGCGKQGDVADFIMMTEQKTLPEALAAIQNKSITDHLPPPPPPKPEKWKLITPCPSIGQITHRDFGKPSFTWCYKDKIGQPIYYVCRFNLPNGKKEFRPYSYWTDGNKSRFLWRGIPTPRPLYGLELLQSSAKATVMLVEGEKTADAARLLFTHILVLTWHGGANAVQEYDWTQLKGRRIILTPDNDYTHTHSDGKIKSWREQPGNMAMLKINEILSPICPIIKWCPAPENKPCGWDWADASDYTSEQAIEYVRENLFEVTEIAAKMDRKETQIPDEKPITPDESEINLPPEHEPIPDAPREDNADRFPFKVLGYENADGRIYYWFFPSASETIVRYSSKQLTDESSIKELAPADYWETYYPVGKGRKIDTASIAEMLRQECTRIGIFDPTISSRGRGAWYDQGRVIIHNGNELIFENKAYPLGDLASRFAYERRQSMGLVLNKPIPSPKANELIKLLQSFRWEREVSAQLLAGWIVLAPFCGVLNWRPHIWITGSAGSGKSYILNTIARPMMGKFGQPVQSDTTEPALRQMLGNDALPIIFDEFEAEQEFDQIRVQSVLKLARAASSNDSGNLVKGSTRGKSITYQVRSCFAFASISQSLIQYADITRVTTLALGNSSSEEKLTNDAKIKQLITPEYAEGLQSRTIWLLPTILKNIKTFSKAVAQELGETRTGDQIGTLAAGAYSLYRTDEITLERAINWVREQDWKEERIKDYSKDEYRCLQMLMEHLTRFDADKMTVERSIGELIFIAAGDQCDSNVTIDKAELRLRQMGIYFKDQMVWISSASNYLKSKVLNNTPWKVKYDKILLRINGAIERESVRFGPAVMAQGVGIPMEILNPKQ